MKKVTGMLLLGAAVFLLVAGIASAAPPVSEDAGKLRAEITMLNADAGLPQGSQIISRQLSDSFQVSSARIDLLSSRNMRYGDIAATLALAEKMPGGINDANINKIVDMRSKAMEWDQIAGNLSVNLREVTARLSSVENTAHNSIKQAFAQAFTSGSAAGGGIHGGAMGEMPGEMPGGATGGTGTNGGFHDKGTGGSGLK